MAAGLALPVLAVTAYTLYFPARGDGAVIWYAKARALFDWVPFKEVPYVNYPDLGPTAWMLVLKWTGPDAEALGRVILPLGFFAWILALLDLFPRPFPWAAAIILPVLTLTSLDLDAATNGFQDFFLAAAAGLALVFLLRLLCKSTTDRSRRDALLLAFFTGSLALIKQEGAVLALMVGAAWLLAAKRKKGLLLAIPLALAWPLLQIGRGVKVSLQYGGFTIGSVLSAFSASDRWITIEPHLQDALSSSAPLLAAFAVLAVYSVIALPDTRRAIVVLSALLVVHTAFVLFVFLATRYPLEWQLNTAFGRLFGQRQFILITGVAFMLGQIAYAARARSRRVEQIDGSS
ncbi:MAG: hypothetical protein ACHQQS_02250 [Thermoanaerobaculales bacterium]